jgi:hypothetical protein
LEPRLSIGTLQLSIRCSSVHFLPSRSLPVSVAGEPAELDAGWPGRVFTWASAGSAKQIVRNAAAVPLYDNRIDGLVKFVVRDWRNRLNSGWIHLATRNL